MNKNKENLTTKHISGFIEKRDTIYIRSMKDFNKPFGLCKFLSFKKGIVTGELIEDIKHGAEKGTVISARLENCALFGEDPSEKRKHFFHFERDGFALRESELKAVKEDSTDSHPSYGVITVGMPFGPERALVGSSIKHSTTVTLAIEEAELHRDYHRDRFYTTKRIIEVEMSPTQFVEMMTSSSRAGGTPCTIRWRQDEGRIADVPFKSKREEFQDEFKKKMHNLTVDQKSTVEFVKNILSKKSLSKADRESVLKEVQSLVTRQQSNIPFITHQFQEQLDLTTKEAKGEIETFFESKIRALGLEEFKSQIVALLPSMTDEAAQLPQGEPGVDYCEICGSTDKNAAGEILHPRDSEFCFK